MVLIVAHKQIIQHLILILQRSNAFYMRFLFAIELHDMSIEYELKEVSFAYISK